MTDTCSCSPGACHGGHTIDEDRLRHIRDGWVTRGNETLEMAAELLAARARVTELEAERDSARQQFTLLFDAVHEQGGSVTTEAGKVVAVRWPEAAQREPIGYGVVQVYRGADHVQTSPILTRVLAEERAAYFRDSLSIESRAIELREVGGE